MSTGLSARYDGQRTLCIAMANEPHLKPRLSHLLLCRSLSTKQPIRENPRESQQQPPTPAELG